MIKMEVLNISAQEHIRVQGHKATAQYYLKRLREGNWLHLNASLKLGYDDLLEYIEQEVSKGGFTLETIGTSEEELKGLRVKGCKDAIQFFLGRLRDTRLHSYDESLKRLRKEVSKGGFTFEAVGTSEEELRTLRLNCSKATAQNWLRLLRKPMLDHYDDYLERLRKEVSKGGFTLETIGTSEEKLRELRLNCSKATAQSWLRWLHLNAEMRSRRSRSSHDQSLKFILREVSKGGFTLETIGTSEEELKTLRLSLKK